MSKSIWSVVQRGEGLSFGNFEDLSYEEFQRIEEILHGESKVEFPWDSSDTFTVQADYVDKGYGDGNRADFLPYQGDSSNPQLYQGPDGQSSMFMQTDNISHGSVPSAQPITGSFTLSNDDARYFDQSGDGNHSNFFYNDQLRSRDEESMSRGSKPYERRNKKKRPPDYYKKAEEEIKAEIQAKLNEGPEHNIGNWHEDHSGVVNESYEGEMSQYISGPPQSSYNPHNVSNVMHSHPPTSEMMDFGVHPPRQMFPPGLGIQHNTSRHDGPRQASGEPSYSAQYQNVNSSIKNFPSHAMNSQREIAHSVQRPEQIRSDSRTEVPNMHGTQYVKECVINVKQELVSNTSADAATQGISISFDSQSTLQNVPGHYTEPIIHEGSQETQDREISNKVTHQLSNLHISQTDSKNGVGVNSSEKVNVPTEALERNDSAITNTLSMEIGTTDSHDTNAACVSDIPDTDVDSSHPGQDLDPDQYPSLSGASKISHPLLPSQTHSTAQGALSNSSQGTPDESVENSHSNTALPSSVPDSNATKAPSGSSGSVWGAGPSKSSWAGLFRNVDPAKQGYVVSVNESASTDAPKSLPSKPQETTYTPEELVKTEDDPIAKSLGGTLNVYKVQHNQIGLQPRGLNNRGNWCYINATLQALVSCPPFYNLMKIFPVYSPIRDGKSSTPIIDSMVKFVNEFTPCARPTEKGRRLLSTLEPGSPFEPVYVYRMLQVMEANPSFRLGKQEDAEEFLSCILDGMHEEMSALIRAAQGKSDDMKANGYVEGEAEESSEDVDPDSWEQVGPKKKHVLTRRANFDKTPLADIFVGYTRSALYKSTSKESATLQPFFTLQLDIQSEKVLSVRDALDGLVSKESVSGFTCSQTKAELDVMRRMTLEELPPVLILHLKFFVYDKDGGSQKLMKKIDYNIDLEVTKDLLSPNVRNKLQIHQRSYKLFAVVYHHGKKTTGGHYTTAVFHPAINNWIIIDDSSVKQVNVGQVLKYVPQRVPYLLYYRRVDMH
ncbi:hypothetical protein FSP39_001407 [Pinctada imbricata]|uniref:ubiquitinyl hydrolase 1 n=1 Tax=Pinctada imbricata TaxID=66713 RepID=A0AA89BWM4_PINIB|nr:hypothetical protein FSP39_001407 [Pinctada imbricata]